MNNDKFDRFLKLKKTMQERNEFIEKNKQNEIGKREKLLIYQKMLKEKNEYVPKNIIFKNPLIYSINNFLLPYECKHIIELSKNKLKDATLSSVYGDIVDNKVRNNKVCWIEHNESWICDILTKRIENLIKIPLENAEKIQVIHYNVGEYFNAHMDSYSRDGSERSKKYMKYGGQRIYTCLIYLNNVIEGGETYFTELDHYESPEEGKILIFKNIDNKKDRNILSKHMGCSVKKGEKYAINLWFREEKIDLSNPFKYVPLKKYINYLDDFYKNILKDVYVNMFTYNTYKKDIELCILKDIANNHFDNRYLFEISVNCYKYNKFLVINNYNIDIKIFENIINYYDYCSKNIKQTIKDDIISRTLQYELLEYFNLFTCKSLIPYSSKIVWNNDGDSIVNEDYTILININKYSVFIKDIYLDKNGIVFIDPNENYKIKSNGEFLILFYKLKI